MTIRAFYKTGIGLSGCYLDDNQGGALEYNTRRQLADAIRYELELHEWPKACFNEVNIRRLWSAIKFAKSASSYTFHIHHKGHTLTFYGLTFDEYTEEIAREDY